MIILRQTNRHRLSCEALKSQRLLAGNVTEIKSGNALTLRGDDLFNDIAVFASPPTAVQVNGNDTNINGKSQPVASDGARPMECRYTIQSVWPAADPVTRQQAIDFWLEENAFESTSTAEARADELLVVARESTGCVAAVSTAFPLFIPRLGFKCFYYRTFVGRRHRTRGLRSTGLFWSVMKESFCHLNERFQRGIDPDVLGCYAEIENPSIMRSQRELIWQQAGVNVVYLGYNKSGKQIRAWYFDGAKMV